MRPTTCEWSVGPEVSVIDPPDEPPEAGAEEPPMSCAYATDVVIAIAAPTRRERVARMPFITFCLR